MWTDIRNELPSTKNRHIDEAVIVCVKTKPLCTGST